MDELLDCKNPNYNPDDNSISQRAVKLKALINSIVKYGGTRKDVAKSAGMSEQMLNNLASQDREVLELANGDYILTSKHTKIFKKPS